ncbi:MAG: hypothetical protein KDC75_20310 [Phaeodactylibacter sp.]|nr:hypothetical protein [Phaeodactylibacter sp.]
MKKIRFSNKELGVTSTDISNCEDRDQLLEWLVFIESHLTTLSSQVNAAKGTYQSGGKVDKDWFHRLKTYKRVQGTLKFQIQAKLAELKKIENAKNEERQLSSDRIKADFWLSKVKYLAPEKVNYYYDELIDVLKNKGL